jgi:hypothetical protein
VAATVSRKSTVPTAAVRQTAVASSKQDRLFSQSPSTKWYPWSVADSVKGNNNSNIGSKQTMTSTQVETGGELNMDLYNHAAPECQEYMLLYYNTSLEQLLHCIHRAY